MSHGDCVTTIGFRKVSHGDCVTTIGLRKVSHGDNWLMTIMGHCSHHEELYALRKVSHGDNWVDDHHGTLLLSHNIHITIVDLHHEIGDVHITIIEIGDIHIAMDDLGDIHITMVDLHHEE